MPHFIHSPTDGHLGCMHFVAMMSNAAAGIYMYKSSCDCVLSVFLGGSLGVELPGRMVTTRPS